MDTPVVPDKEKQDGHGTSHIRLRSLDISGSKQNVFDLDITRMINLGFIFNNIHTVILCAC